MIIHMATSQDLDKLFKMSSITWEKIARKDFEAVINRFSLNGEGYWIKGKVMNEKYNLTGTEAYPEELNILSIPYYKGMAIWAGARWFDDIVNTLTFLEELKKGSEKYGNK